MMNPYHPLNRKVAHPCWINGHGYVCPICNTSFMTEAPMEWHYLSEHLPSQEDAKKIVRYDRYRKHFRTPEWSAAEATRKRRAKITKAMKTLGYQKIKSKFWTRQGYAFALGSDFFTWEDAEKITNL